MDWRVKIFADGADLKSILDLNENPMISGFTTNPTLMKKAGVTDYQGFALEVCKHIKDKPLSFEVFADDFPEMYRQAKLISKWGKNVYVKIPIQNTKGQKSKDLITQLAKEGVKLNVTAILTIAQVMDTIYNIKNCDAIISVFAGRLADIGRNANAIMSDALNIMATYPKQQLLWASTREAYNVVQANALGVHIITCTPDILKKVEKIGSVTPQEVSLDTVKMFYNDAQASGFVL
jgi:transaldolase